MIAASHEFPVFAQITITDLGTLGGRGSLATTINDRGQVVGNSSTASDEINTHAFIWENGVMTNLGTLGGNSSYIWGYPYHHNINHTGQVVGWSKTSSNAWHAFIWQSGTMIDLGTLGGNDSYAAAISDSGQVVGWSVTASGSGHALYLGERYDDCTWFRKRDSTRGMAGGDGQGWSRLHCHCGRNGQGRQSNHYNYLCACAS